MLVLESGPTSINSSPTSMLTPGGNQYIQPDYLSPLPTTLDAKRSPLALLAQTCSQIGADPPTGKSSDKAKKETSLSESGKSSKTPPVSSKGHENNRREDNANSKTEDNRESSNKSGFKSPGVSSSKSGCHNISTTHSTLLSSASASNSVSTTTTALSDSRTSTTESKLIESTHRSALDALQGLPKDVPLGTYRPHGVFSSLPGLTPYPGLDAATAAALGLGAGAFRHPYPPLGGIPGYPPVSLGLSLAGYPALNYGRIKSVGGSESLIPMSVCRDPYCTGCPSSVLGMTGASPSVVVTSAGVCPAGCTQCDHQKLVGLSTSQQQHSLSTAIASTTTTPTSATSPFSPGTNNQRPYVCNWIAGDNYCGKRFTSSEELLQHLRTHTSLSVPASESASTFSPLLNPSLHPHNHLLAASSSAAAAAALHRTYPTPPLSPLSMARYHPYSKPSAAALSTLAGSSPLSNLGAGLPNPLSSLSNSNPLLSLGNASVAQSQLATLGAGSSLAGANALASLSAHNPLSPYAANPLAGHPSLGAYYSHPYSLYSQRLGAGVLP